MKKKIRFIMVLVIILSLFGIKVQALQDHFTFDVNPKEKNVKPGEVVLIQLSISDITTENEGITSVQGDLSFSNESIIDSVEIVKNEGENWSVAYNTDDESQLKGTFLINNFHGMTTSQTIGKLKIKIKSTAKAGEKGEIYLKGVHSSYAKQTDVREEDKTYSYDKTIKLTIVADENTPPPTDPPTDPTPTNQNPTEQKKATYTPTNNTDNTKANKSFSKTGLNSIGTVILVIGIVSIIGFVINKKIKID